MPLDVWNLGFLGKMRSVKDNVVQAELLPVDTKEMDAGDGGPDAFPTGRERVVLRLQKIGRFDGLSAPYLG